MPLFGHSTQLRVFVDPDLLKYDPVDETSGQREPRRVRDRAAQFGGRQWGVVTDLKRG